MSNVTRIELLRGRRVWDSRGRPTVEAEVTLGGGARGRAIAPAGASTGSGEALDKRDGGSAFGGYDVSPAVGAVEGEIAGALVGADASDQDAVDKRLIALDRSICMVSGSTPGIAKSCATAKLPASDS